jgi:ABC-type Fe3+-hydroxamate transport system substrate-binding protein
MAAGLPVLVTDPTTVREAVGMVRELWEILEARGRAEELARTTERELTREIRERRRVFVPIWWKPLMAMGGDSYGHDLLSHAGGVNVLAAEARYPMVTMEHAGALHPDLVLLPDEPYRFREAHVQEFASIAPARVIDGKLLWWYGPRMPAAIRELREIIGSSSE